MAKKKDDDLNADERAVAAAERLSKILIEQGGILENNRSILDSISETFGIKARDFQASIKRTADQTKALQKEIQEKSIGLVDQITNSFSKVSEKVHNQTGTFTKNVMNGLKSLSTIDQDMADGLGKALETGDFMEFWDNFGEQGMKAFQKLTQDQKGFKQFKKLVTDDAIEGWKKQQKEIDEMNKRLQNSVEKVFSIRKTVATIGNFFTKDFMPKNILDKLYDFDQILNDTQREFGLAMDKNKAKFSELIGQTQIFGLSTKETGEFMGKLGENLRTTNWGLLGTAAKDMAAIGKATGLSVDEMAQLGTQMMFYGRTSKDVAKFTEETMQMAQKYGLNAKKVLQEVTKALPTMRSLGWQGGEKALRDMVIQAQKLGQNMDDLTASAKKLRTLEGSIEASADLALVGVNTNAIQMLAAARRGGKEFSSFVADLTKGIGQIKKDGSVEFDPIDVDRLQVISDSIGIPLEKLQDQVALTAQRNAKANLFPQSMFRGLKPEEQEFLLNAAKIGEGGKIELDASILGTKDLSKVSSSLIDGAMSQKKAMEEQAKENTSFNESVTNLKQSIYNIFTHLQPFIENLTDIVTGFNTWLNKFGETTKKWIAAGVLFSAVVFSVAKNWMAGYWQGLGFDAGVKKGGIFSSFGKMIGDRLKGVGRLFGLGKRGGTGDITGEINNTNNNGGGASRGVGSFTEALKAMPSPAQLLALAAAIAAVGVAFIGIGYGIKLASEGLAELVKSFNGITNAGYALGAVVAVMGGFVGMLGVMISLVGALGGTATAVWPGLLALGAAFVGIGFGIKLAGEGISLMISSFSDFAKTLSNSTSITPQLLILGGALAIFTPTLLAFGLAGIASAPGLLAMSLAFGVLAPSLSLLTSSLEKISKINPGILSNIGKSLGTLSLGIISLSAIGALFPLVALTSGALLLLSPALSSLVPAVEKLSRIDFGVLKSVSSALTGMIPSLFLFSTIGAVAPLLIGASVGLGILGKALTYFSGLKINNLPTIIQGVSDSVGSLIKFSTIGLFAPAIILGSSALGILGLALNNFTNLDVLPAINSLKSLSSIVPSLIAFSAIGIFAAPILIGAGVLSVLGLAIPKFVSSLSNLQNIKTDGINNLNESLIKFVPALLGLSIIGILAIPIMAGATMLSASGILLERAGVGFMNFANLNWSSFKNVRANINDLLVSLFKLSSLSIIAAPVLVGSTMLAGAGVMLSIASKGFESFSKINFGGFEKFTSIIPEFILGLAKLSVISLIALPVMIGSAMLAVAGVSLGIAAKGFNALTGVDFAKLSGLSQGINEIFRNIIKLSAIGLASPLLIVAGAAIGALGIGINTFSKTDTSNIKNISDVIDGLIPSLFKFSLIGVLSAPLMFASAALGLLGPAFSSLSKGVAQAAGIDWTVLNKASDGLTAALPSLLKFSLLGVLSAPITMGAIALGIMGKSMLSAATGFKAMSNIDWSSVDTMGSSINNLLPSLVNFGLKGLVAAPGIWLMNSTIGSLATTMERLANPLDIANQSLGSMSDNINRLKSAIQGLDTSKLNNLASASDRFANSTVSSTTSVQPVVAESKPQKITLDPIHINLKLNGRDVQEIIVKDTAYHT